MYIIANRHSWHLQSNPQPMVEKWIIIAQTIHPAPSDVEKFFTFTIEKPQYDVCYDHCGVRQLLYHTPFKDMIPDYNHHAFDSRKEAIEMLEKHFLKFGEEGALEIEIKENHLRVFQYRETYGIKEVTYIWEYTPKKILYNQQFKVFSPLSQT